MIDRPRSAVNRIVSYCERQVASLAAHSRSGPKPARLRPTNVVSKADLHAAPRRFRSPDDRCTQLHTSLYQEEASEYAGKSVSKLFAFAGLRPTQLPQRL